MGVGMAAFGVRTFVPTMRQRWSMARRSAWRSVGVVQVAGAILVIGGTLIVMAAHSENAGGVGLPGYTLRVVEALLPLIIGLSAGLLFAPDDEPALEIQAASPRPLYYLLLERGGLMFGVMTAIALGWLLVGQIVFSGEDLLAGTLRWLPPSLCMAGIAMSISVETKHSAFSVLTVLMLWFAMMIGFHELIALFPFLYPVYLFLDPTSTSEWMFTLNRVLLVTVGLALVAYACQRATNEEHILSRSN
jgi:hypothetical protein